jgi:uncharacterized protein (DUF2147 family)
MSPLVRLFAVCLLLAGSVASAGEADVLGRWLSGDGDGWIDIRQDGDTVVGIIVGSPNSRPGQPERLDTLNPDPALRHRKLLGLAFMKGFVYAGDDRWTGGTIYNPNSGKTYKGTMTLVGPDTLKLRGYIGISLFGRSDTWTRVRD